MQNIGDTLLIKKSVITYKFLKADHFSQICISDIVKDKVSDPQYNYEVFAETVRNHYVFFELNQINWDSLYHFQKETLANSPDDITLYEVISATLDQLNDNHAFIEASEEFYDLLPEETTEVSQSATSNILPEIGDFQVAEQVAEHHLTEEITKDSWLMKWGKFNDSVGFIEIKAMWLYADLNIAQSVIEELGYVDAYVHTFHQMYEGEYINEEVKGVRITMNKVMADLAPMSAIVIDVRFNGGGQDAVSFEILRHFISGKQQVATEKLRFKDGHSPTIPLFINGALKHVYILNSQQTASAGESFALATLDTKQIKRIGAHTSGALSTALEKTLPNGWSFSISNELFMDNNGRYYENIGIPVQYEIKYPSDRQEFFRSVLNDLDNDKDDILQVIDSLTKN